MHIHCHGWPCASLTQGMDPNKERPQPSMQNLLAAAEAVAEAAASMGEDAVAVAAAADEAAACTSQQQMSVAEVLPCCEHVHYAVGSCVRDQMCCAENEMQFHMRCLCSRLIHTCAKMCCGCPSIRDDGSCTPWCSHMCISLSASPSTLLPLLKDQTLLNTPR